MRAVVALGLARQVVVSSASVSSTLAGFQKFTDKMVAKYGQEPVDDLDEAAKVDALENSGTQGEDDTQDTVTQVTGAGGVNHEAGAVSESGVDDKDKKEIEKVIEWLEGLDQDLLAQHVEDDNLQKECQAKLDKCESVDQDETKPGNSHSDAAGKVHYFEIGSHLTQGLGWHSVGLAGRSVLSPVDGDATLDRTDDNNLKVCDACTQENRELDGGNMPTYETDSDADKSKTITAFAVKVEPAHYSSGEQKTDGVGVISGEFGRGSQAWAGKAPWTNVITRTGEEKCTYMTQLTQGDGVNMYGGLQLDAFYSPTESGSITTPAGLVVKSGDWQGTREFLANEQNPGFDKCGSRWTQMREFEMRHDSCRRNHQSVACADQQVKCDSYDACRASTRETEGAPTANDLNCYQFPSCAIHAAPEAGAGDLRDEYISTEWWFKERKDMESCLEKTTQWFVPLWDKYELCDQAIKYCAEATLTCDNIQWEFEARHCEWDTARKESCDAHYECYEKEVRRCAQTCDIVKLRERGRKAEFEIIERIICMLKALLANNDEHFDSGERTATQFSEGNTRADGGTGSFRIADDRNSDYGSKKSRLAECKTMTVDASQFNLVCQGPKVRNVDGDFAVGDQFSHYRHWSLERGGEFPRLPNQVNGGCSQSGGTCENFVDQISVSSDEWKGSDTDGTETVRKYTRVKTEEAPEGTDCAGDDPNADCKWTFQETVEARHRVDGSYTPWGFDCDFRDRPCTHQFIVDHYAFLSAEDTPNMERAPCHDVCGATVFPESYAHDGSSLCDLCPATKRSLNHRTGDCACLEAHAAAEGEDCASGETSCACLISRDENFCDHCEGESTCGECSDKCREMTG